MKRCTINLFDETLDEFARNGHTIDDIEFVDLFGVDIDPDEFVLFMNGFEYDPGYGREYVPPFTVAMNDGTWYERAEYDGSEWWVYRHAPKAPERYGTIVDALAHRDWAYPEALKHAEDVDYATACEEELLEWEEQLRRERMDALCDEIEGDLDKPTESGKWAGLTGKCARKARCKRYTCNERRFELGGGWLAKPLSRCWKDQRGKGGHKRYAQYH